jgi:hypothetical protein
MVLQQDLLRIVKCNGIISSSFLIQYEQTM